VLPVLTYGLYVVLLVAIGVYFFPRTETKHLANYMLAGRKVGTWSIAISEVAFVGLGATLGLPLAFPVLWRRTAGAGVLAAVGLDSPAPSASCICGRTPSRSSSDPSRSLLF